MDNAHPCTICKETDHKASMCPELYSPEKVSGGGGGGQGHDDDEKAKIEIAALEPSQLKNAIFPNPDYSLSYLFH